MPSIFQFTFFFSIFQFKKHFHIRYLIDPHDKQDQFLLFQFYISPRESQLSQETQLLRRKARTLTKFVWSKIQCPLHRNTFLTMRVWTMNNLTKYPLNKVPSGVSKFLKKKELSQFNSINTKCNMVALEAGHLLSLWPLMKEGSHYLNSSLIAELEERNQHILIPIHAARHRQGTINPNIPVKWASYSYVADEQNKIYPRAKGYPMKIKSFIQDHPISGSVKILKPSPHSKSKLFLWLYHVLVPLKKFLNHECLECL